MKANILKKKQEVENLKRLISNSPVIGILDLVGLPSSQFQKMRAKLKNSVIIRVAKKRLIRLALKEAEKDKPGITRLEEALKDCIPAMIFTSQDPFRLSKTLSKSKSNAPAKVGQKAPREIIIPAGPTSFSPGPIIGELGQSGIQAGIEAGKVIIKKDCLLLKEGETITERKLGILTRFAIMPMEIGLNLVSLYENGIIYGKDVLSIDEATYISNIIKAVQEARNLAINVNYPTKETIIILIQKAYFESKSLAKSSNISTEDVKKLIKEAEDTSKNLINELNVQKSEEDISKEKVKKKSEEFEIKQPMPYSEETAKRAEEIILEMKDKAIRKDAHGGK